MLQILIGPDTFRRDFLDGKGSVTVESAGAPFDPLKPFDPSVARLHIVSANADAQLSFGQQEGLSCGVVFDAGSENGIELSWPDANQPEDTLPEGKLAARLFLSGRVGAEASGVFPAGAASFHFGVSAGSAVGYERRCLFDRRTRSGRIISELIGGLRLPQHCGTPSSIPDEGEVVSFRYAGFLDLEARLNWGYELTGIEGFQYREIDASFHYGLRLKAGVKAGYQLAGEFDVEASRGSRPGWARLTVRKQQASRSDFAAAFRADGDLRLGGLPQSADEFLAALIGVDAESVRRLFERARTFTDLDQLEQAAGRLLKKTVHDLAQKWIGKALDNTNVQQFLGAVNRFLAEHQNADQAVVNAIAALYEDNYEAGKLGELRRSLALIAGLRSPDELRTLNDEAAWTVIERLAGADVPQLLQDDAAFARLTKTAERGVQFLEGGWMPQLRDLILELKSSFPLDRVFQELTEYASEEKLLTLADERLQGLVEKLVGKAWEEIKESGAAAVAAELRDTLDKITSFKDTWYARLTSAASQSFALQVNYAFSRASRSKALLDIEIDVTTPQGQKLFADAAVGKMRGLFDRANLPLLVVHEGLLTHELTKASHLSVAVFGWQFKRLAELVSRTEYSLEALPTGMVRVFTTEAAIRRRIEQRGRDEMAETIESNFLLRLVGETYRPDEFDTLESLQRKSFLARSINKMAVEYRFFAEDDLTSVSELGEYLKLAEILGLIPSAHSMAEQLGREFPGGLGKVTARYLVTYDSDSLRDAFTLLSGEPLKQLARATARQVAAARLIQRKNDRLAAVGFAYLDPYFADLYYRQGFTALLNDDRAIRLPNWFTGGETRIVPLPARDAGRHVLATLFAMEQKMADRLARLDEVVDEARKQKRPVKDSELEQAAKDFVATAAKIDQFISVNSFFAVFDRFIYEGSRGKGFRQSAMILQIQPPGETEPVTKFFASGSLDGRKGELKTAASA